MNIVCYLELGAKGTRSGSFATRLRDAAELKILDLGAACHSTSTKVRDEGLPRPSRIAITQVTYYIHITSGLCPKKTKNFLK